jgi:hypothetical protein
MTVCREEMEACLEKREENPEEIDAVMEHQDVPNKGATVETIRALMDQPGDQRHIVGYQNPLKKWTQVHVVCKAPKNRRSRRDDGHAQNTAMAKRTKFETSAMSGRQGHTLQGCQADPRDGGHRTGSQVFHQALRNE